MIILNQDRDTLNTFTAEHDILSSCFNILGDTIYGFNLNLNETILGTFDSVSEVLEEMSNILRCEYGYYVVGGFTDYMGCFLKKDENN